MSFFKKMLLLIAMGIGYPLCIFSMNIPTDASQIKETLEMNDDTVQAFKDYEKYLDIVIKPLEECAEADERNVNNYFTPCSEVLHIGNHPKNGALRYKVNRFLRKMPEAFIKHHGEDAAKKMLQEKVGSDTFIEKTEKEHTLWRRCTTFDKLEITQDIMRQKTDTRRFNAHLPRILGDLCEHNTHEGIARECKELQGAFHHREMDLRGEYSPFPESLEYDPTPQDWSAEWHNLKWNINRIAVYYRLSIPTTYQLMKLTQAGYEGDGRCEAGPALNREQEFEYDRQIHEQFPEELKNHCNKRDLNEDDFIACHNLRRSMYEAQNPEEVEVHPHRLYDSKGDHDIWRLFGEDKRRINSEERSKLFKQKYCHFLSEAECKRKEGQYFSLYYKTPPSDPGVAETYKMLVKDHVNDVCSSKNDRLGCRSREEMEQCIKEFNATVEAFGKKDE